MRKRRFGGLCERFKKKKKGIRQDSTYPHMPRFFSPTSRVSFLSPSCCATSPFFVVSASAILKQLSVFYVVINSMQKKKSFLSEDPFKRFRFEISNINVYLTFNGYLVTYMIPSNQKYLKEEKIDN